MPIKHRLKLKAGELVEVRTKEEIFSTLDANGCLEEMPFMPEMLRYCGKQLRVYKRAHKSCDTINFTGGLRLSNAVHLDGNRCDGGAHGGCQAECLIFWKEAWLKRVKKGTSAATSPTPSAPSVCTEETVHARSFAPTNDPQGEPTYSCQATQLLKATQPLPWWDVRQYVEDYTSRNFSFWWMTKVSFYAFYNILAFIPFFGRWTRKLYNWVQRKRGKPRHPRTPGLIPAGAPTPAADLKLQPGEMVRVKDFEEIRQTIDTNYRNRGLKWDAEMVPYCGGTYRVHKRVKSIINEGTGKMMHFGKESIILENVICQARHAESRYFCPRAVYPYWREIWLERASEAKSGTTGDTAPKTGSSPK